MCCNDSRNVKRILRIALVLMSVAIILKVYYELKLLDLLVGVFKLEKDKKILPVCLKNP